MGRIVIYGSRDQIDELKPLLEDRTDHQIEEMNSATFMVVLHPGAQGNQDVIKDAISEASSINDDPESAIVIE